MSKFRKLSISSFKGDKGWKLRDTYSDLVKDIERYCFPKIFCYTVYKYCICSRLINHAMINEYNLRVLILAALPYIFHSFRFNCVYF